MQLFHLVHNDACSLSVINAMFISESIEDTLTINIIDVNDVTPSCEKQLYSLDIPENVTIGSTVLPLICTDGDDDPNGINNGIGSYIITEGNTGTCEFKNDMNIIVCDLLNDACRLRMH